MDLTSKLKFSAPETYTDKSDVDQQKFKDLNEWHWEDKDLPFLKDEYPGEDTHEYKKNPKVYQELDNPPQQAYNGVQASLILRSKLSWSSIGIGEEWYDPSPLNEMNLYPSKREDNKNYKKRNTKGDEEMLFEKGQHESVERPESLRDTTPFE